MVYHSMLEVENHPVKILLSGQRDKDDAKQRDCKGASLSASGLLSLTEIRLYLLPRIKVQIIFFGGVFLFVVFLVLGFFLFFSFELRL